MADRANTSVEKPSASRARSAGYLPAGSNLYEREPMVIHAAEDVLRVLNECWKRAAPLCHLPVAKVR